MKLRLLFDEDVHAALAPALRKRGYDAMHVVELRRLGLSDDRQLSFATAEDRCLVTFNVGDFVRLHNRRVQLGQSHGGIIVSKQLTVSESLRRLLALLQKESAESLAGQLRFL